MTTYCYYCNSSIPNTNTCIKFLTGFVSAIFGLNLHPNDAGFGCIQIDFPDGKYAEAFNRFVSELVFEDGDMERYLGFSETMVYDRHFFILPDHLCG